MATAYFSHRPYAHNDPGLMLARARRSEDLVQGYGNYLRFNGNASATSTRGLANAVEPVAPILPRQRTLLYFSTIVDM